MILNELSTYANLIFDALREVSEDSAEQIPEKQLIQWINRAQERITDVVDVKDDYILSLGTTAKHNFQDRPAITGATDETPIVLSSTNNGLISGDRITSRGALGNTAANGRFQVTVGATNTFSLYHFADIAGATASATTVEIDTLTAHGFSTGDLITHAAVEGMTDLNDSFAITVTGETNYTVDLTTTQTYTQGGVATKPTVGNGTYTGGGRFWKSDEIPTFFKDFKSIQTVGASNGYQTVSMRELDYVNAKQADDTELGRFYADNDTPLMAALGASAGTRYLMFYPAASADKDVTLFGNVHVIGRLYDADPVNATIILPSMFDEAIKAYLKAKIYEQLKDRQSRGDALVEFRELLDGLDKNQPTHSRINITYR